MAAYLIAYDRAGSTNNDTVTTPGINTSGADLIVLIVGYNNGPPTSITDSKGNTWTPLTAYPSSGNFTSIRAYYCAAPTVGAGHTFTANLTGGFPTIAALAFAGGSTFDQENGVNDGASITSVNTGSITSSADEALTVAAVTLASAAAGGAAISDQSFLLRVIQFGANTHAEGLVVFYGTQQNASSVDPLLSWEQPSACAATVASFSSGGGGGGGGGGSTGVGRARAANPGSM
jgi:hypothetical protein